MKKKNRKKYILIALSIIGLVVLGWVVSEVGGIDIRRNAAGERELTVAQTPLVPGLPFSVSWDVEPEDTDRSTLLVLHTAEGEYELAATRFVQGSLAADLPCEISAGTNTLQLIELVSRRVLMEQAVEVLPPGPDCA